MMVEDSGWNWYHVEVHLAVIPVRKQRARSQDAWVHLLFDLRLVTYLCFSLLLYGVDNNNYRRGVSPWLTS